MRTTVKVRGKINAGHVKKRYQAGRDKALDRIGAFTMQAAKKQFLNKTPKKKPEWRRVGERDGVPVLEISFRPPTAGRVTSWKTGKGRAANGFLRSSVRYERDDRRGSVVIGPAERAVWLNRIQEFGGSRPVAYRYLTKAPTDKLRKSGHAVPGGVAWIVTRRDAMTGRKSQAGEFKREAGKVKPGRYMAKGLDKVRPKIPLRFQGFIQGP
jgi:hypothetical protein